MSCCVDVGRDVWQVSRCGAHLPGHSLSPCLHPSHPESGLQGHNSAVSQVQSWSVILRRQLGACCSILLPHKALPLSVPQFPCLATFPQHHRGTAAVPAAPGPGGPAEPPRPLPVAAPGAGSAAFSPYINKNFTARWQEMHFQFICCSY